MDDVEDEIVDFYYWFQDERKEAYNKYWKQFKKWQKGE